LSVKEKAQIVIQKYCDQALIALQKVSIEPTRKKALEHITADLINREH
jgi:geranylgeranyl pyrophosphate synthase